MTIFAVRYAYTEDSASRDEHRPAHREFLSGLADEGVLLASGPFADDGPPGAVLLLRADSADGVRELLRQDPFQQQGAVEHLEVREWTPVLGTLRDRLTAEA